MAAVTLSQQLRNLNPPQNDPTQRVLQDMVGSICTYIEKAKIFRTPQDIPQLHPFYERAKGALFVYAISDAGREFDPPVNWHTIMNYADQVYLEHQAVKDKITEFFSNGNLEQLDFKDEIEKIRPIAKAFIQASLQIPNRDEIDRQTEHRNQKGDAFLNEYLEPRSCCILV